MNVDTVEAPPLVVALEALGYEPVAGYEDGAWSSRCPAHDDHSPSLSVGIGNDGRTLAHCFAGCLTEDVMAAVGLTMWDLFAHNEEAVHRARDRNPIVPISMPAAGVVAPLPRLGPDKWGPKHKHWDWVGKGVQHPVMGCGTVLKPWRDDGVRVSWYTGEVSAVLPSSFDRWDGQPTPVPENTLMHYGLAEVIDEDYRLQWQIRDFWTLGGFGQIAGPEKSLKSYVLAMICLAVASGRPLFGLFEVVTPGPVVLFTAEGTRHLVRRRMEHLAQTMDLTQDELRRLPIEIIDEAAQIQSERFLGTFKNALAQRPGLIGIDPLYAYQGGKVEAGNVYSAGEMLTSMSELTQAANCSLILANHFNKAGSQSLELVNITQAGGREWCHNWVLIKKRAEPDLKNQSFELEFKVGSREGYGGHYDLDVHLGPLDRDTVRHTGTPVVTVGIRDEPDPKAEMETTIIGILATSPWKLTKTDLKARLRGSQEDKVTAIDVLEGTGRIETRPEKRIRTDGKARTVKVLGLVAGRSDTQADTQE